MHISNRYSNLEWVVRAEAAALGKQALYVSDHPSEDEDYTSSDWMLVSGVPGAFEAREWKGLGVPSPRPSHARLWTDEYSNLLQILK